MEDKPINILIVDDDDYDRQIYKKNITKYLPKQFLVTEADSGQSALQICAGLQPDCILIDYYMPGLNGINFMDEITSSSEINNPAIIFLTGKGDETIAAEVIRKGAVDYIPKAKVRGDVLAESIKKSIDVINHKKRLQHQASITEELAYTDHLTKLLNRTSFNEQLTRSISLCKRHERQCAVLFIDLDRFKIINDIDGHQTGDKILIEVARRIKEVVRNEDLVGRIGGDEFVVGLSEINQKDDAAFVANKIISALNKDFFINSKRHYIGASIGIALYPASSDSPSELLRAADIAMYAAKANGRNSYHFYTEKEASAYSANLKINNEIIKAIKNNQLQLSYLPTIDLITNTIVGIEALLRWGNPAFQHISPIKILQIAESSGLMPKITDWVFRSACKDYQNHLSGISQNIRLTINISKSQLLDDNIDTLFTEVSERLGMPPELIDLDISDISSCPDSGFVPKHIQALRAAGHRIVIDHFGMNANNYNHLLPLLPVDAIKIDKLFVDNIHNDPVKQLLFKTIMNTGQQLGATMIAKGIESREEMDYIKNNGCHIAQGYYFHKPLSIIALADAINDGVIKIK